MAREVVGAGPIQGSESELMPGECGDGEEGEDIRAADSMVRSVAAEWARAFALGGLALPRPSAA